MTVITVSDLPVTPVQLSRRERQIMDSLYQRGEATVADIQKDLPDPPTDSAIRAMLRLLEAKRQVRRVARTRPQVYAARVNREKAGQGAVRHLIDTFFQGSRERAIQAILSSSDTRVNAAELEKLSALIDAAREQEISRD
jgi:predicted transcriptional regulator